MSKQTILWQDEIASSLRSADLSGLALPCLSRFPYIAELLEALDQYAVAVRLIDQGRAKPEVFYQQQRKAHLPFVIKLLVAQLCWHSSHQQVKFSRHFYAAAITAIIALQKEQAEDKLLLQMLTIIFWQASKRESDPDYRLRYLGYIRKIAVLEDNRNYHADSEEIPKCCDAVCKALAGETFTHYLSDVQRNDVITLLRGQDFTFAESGGYGSYAEFIPALSESSSSGSEGNRSPSSSLSSSDAHRIEQPAETAVTSAGIVLQPVNVGKNAGGILSAVIGLPVRLLRRGSSPVSPVSGEHDSVSNTDVDGAEYTP